MFATRVSAQCVATVMHSITGVACAGSVDTFTANYVAGNTYQWLYSPASGSAFTNIPGATTNTYAATASGYYKVLVTHNGCTAAAADSVTFQSAINPVISLSGPGSLCPGQSTVLSANSGNQIIYQWLNNNVPIPGANGVSVTINTNGVYTVRETTSNSCSAVSSSIAIIQLYAPVPVVSPATSFTVCDSTSAILSTATIPGASYTWSKQGVVSYAAIPGAINSFYTATASGTYQVTATYTNGCVENSNPISATFATTPAVPVIRNNSSVCLGSTLQLRVTNDTNSSYSFSWGGPAGFSSGIKDPVRVVNNPNDSGYYKVTVNNNGCTTADSIFIAVTCIDSVWPGDVNADYIVDNTDVLALALGLGHSGSARIGGTAWAPHFCQDWTGDLLPGVNMKHADCDGDGSVGYSDVNAIYLNYDSTHAKSLHIPKATTNGAPNLYFDLSNYRYFYPKESVSIPIVLGSSTVPMNDIMGIAAQVRVLGLTLSTPPTITYPISWLGVSYNTIEFTKTTGSNSLGWAYVRTDHTNASGYGTIANLNFTVPDNIGYNSWVFLYLDNVTIMDNNGRVITGYNVLDDTTVTNPVGVQNVTNTTNTFANIAPNPSAAGGQAYLQADMYTTAAMLSVYITDVTGRRVWQQEQAGQGTERILLPSDIDPGMYFVHVQRSNDNTPQVLKWLKN